MWIGYRKNIRKLTFRALVHRRSESGWKKAGRWNGQSAVGPMCDAEKNWHESSFHASGEIYGCQNFPLKEPEIKFSFFIFEPPVAYFQKLFWSDRPKMQYVSPWCRL